MKFKNMDYRVLIAPTHVPELLKVEHLETGIQFGASVTLSTIDEVLKESIEMQPEQKTGVFRAVVEMLRWFAGHQVRNVAVSHFILLKFLMLVFLKFFLNTKAITAKLFSIRHLNTLNTMQPVFSKLMFLEQ